MSIKAIPTDTSARLAQEVVARHPWIGCVLFALAALIAIQPAFSGDLPNPKITPGVIDPTITQHNIQQTICSQGYVQTVTPSSYFSNKMKKAQIREYGYSDNDLSHYQEDHLIPVDIGGAPFDPKNLWPQSRRGLWSADKKDRLELKLYKLVCSEAVPLDEARKAIAQDWIEAYKKYVLNLDVSK